MVPITAGRSDKYGQVYVERIGNTGFDDPNEPVGLFRAQDNYALTILESYLAILEIDEEVPVAQIESVRRQIEAFHQWREDNPEKIRTPGTHARRE
jgi:hypothetical protein